MNTGNSIKAMNANLPKSINSFMTNTVNSVSNSIKNTTNAMSNVTNNLTNTMGNSFKSISVPVANSINAVPGDSSSIWMMLIIGLLVTIIVLVIFFSKQITEASKDLWKSLKKSLGYAEVEIKDISAQASQQLDEAVSGVESTFKMDSSSINKFVPGKKQVFNISENRYTYSDAEPLCRAFGAELATYDQVKDAWGQGADWCNYGWIKGQAAVYPTQQSTWDKLQTGTDDERLQCGMPGVNGGFFDNPELRFGVNCYGPKPSEIDNDVKNLMEGNNHPMTPEMITEKKKELKFRSERNQIPILPFRDNTWSE
jgi:Sec-independent protein translocase protein TatA